MNIECIECRGINNETLKAVAKVKIHDLGIIINDIKLFNKGASYWVSMPDKSYQKDGETKYFKLIQFIDKEKEKQILEDIRDCILKEKDVGKQWDQGNKEKTLGKNEWDGLF